MKIDFHADKWMDGILHLDILCQNGCKLNILYKGIKVEGKKQCMKY